MIVENDKLPLSAFAAGQTVKSTDNGMDYMLVSGVTTPDGCVAVAELGSGNVSFPSATTLVYDWPLKAVRA